MKITIYLALALLFVGGPAGVFAQGDYYYSKGYKAENNGEYAEAFAFYSLAINSEPLNEKYYIARGDLVSSLRVDDKTIEQKVDYYAFQEAEKDYNKALELEPDCYMAYMSRGNLFYNYHELDKAKADFDQAVKLAFYERDLLFAKGARGSVKFKMNEVDGALFDLEKALELDTSNTYVLNELGYVYLRLKEYAIAEQYYQRILAKYPDNIVAQSNIGFARLKAGKYQEALRIYNEALQINPQKALLYSNRALVYHHLGHTEEALADINYSLSLYPANSYALHNRAVIYLSIGKKDQACKDLHLAKELGYTVDYGDEVIDLLLTHCLEVNKKRIPKLVVKKAIN